MLPVHLSTIRLFLHVLAATVWVGGQIVLAGLVPSLRKLGPDAPKAVARQFNKIAWAAFAVLIITGLWNLSAVHMSDQSTQWMATLMAKLGVVAITGVAAAIHAGTSSKKVLAISGALAGLAGILAVFFGILLTGAA